jgi:glyoxylase-like metal-dependent hydrolase (beta-lactamase superfamily II)
MKGANFISNLGMKLSKIIGHGFPPVKIKEKDIVITAEEYDLQKIGVKGKTLHTPGHTPGHLAVILEDGTAFAGDVTMNFFRLFRLQKRPIIMYDFKEVLRSWEKIIETGAVKIYPAHGPPFEVEELIEKKNKFEKEKT